jgi:uncharacterized membrane protein
MPGMDGRRRSRNALVAMLVGAGVAHFAVPKGFDTTIPRQLPGKPRTYTYVSGVVELTCAALVALPRTRRLGAALTAATFVAVFPANIQAAIDNPPKDRLGVAMLVRLPLQYPLIRWAWSHTRA